ncbi:MAG: glycosyltransferase family 4 protein, partial [Patescibacteria group bacterium]|nr:glycosyltransferase family 4 protein [Patescibacteria group bacterium]
MKKIALMHYAYPPNVGGVELLLREQARILDNLGYHVTIITGNGRNDDPNIDLFEVEEIQSILRFNPNLYEKIVVKGIVNKEFFSLVNSIRNKIEKYLDKQDVIIIHNILTLIHNLPLSYFLKDYIKRNPQKKYIIWVHDQTFIDKGAILERKEGVNLSDQTRKILFEPVKNASYVVISNALKDLFCKVMKMPKNKVQVIPNGVNVKDFLEIDDPVWKFSKQFNLLSRYPIILSPVNILERKNIEYCIEIVAKLTKKYPEIAYIISGQPSKHRNTQKYLEKINLLIAKYNLENNVFFATKLMNKSLSNNDVSNF